MQDLSSPTRDQTRAGEARSPNHWPTREFPRFVVLYSIMSSKLTLLTKRVLLAPKEAILIHFYFGRSTGFEALSMVLSLSRQANLVLCTHCTDGHREAREAKSYTQDSTMRQSVCVPPVL